MAPIRIMNAYCFRYSDKIEVAAKFRACFNECEGWVVEDASRRARTGEPVATYARTVHIMPLPCLEGVGSIYCHLDVKEM